MSKPGPISAKPLSVLLSDVFSDAYAKQGFAARELVTRWAEIAGPEVAAHSEPLKMQWPRPVEGSRRNRPRWCCGWRARWRWRSSTPPTSSCSGSTASSAGARSAGWRCGRRRCRAGIGRRARRAPDAEVGGGGRGNPVRGRGRGTAGRAGAARRLDQAKLSLPPRAGVAARHCHNCRFKPANGFFSDSLGVNAPIREQTLIITRRAFTAALSLTGLAALAGFSPLRLIADAMAQSASDVAKPVSLPDMALGPANATVTITEYASMTCPHCAAFNENVFPKIKSEYHRQRQDPLRVPRIPARHQGRGAARCWRAASPRTTPAKYFAVIDLLFKPAERLGDEEHHGDADPDRQAGRPQPAGRSRTASKDQALLDKIAADQKFATEVLKVNSTPTFFINGEMIKGETSFEEFDKKIKSLLKS